jgi:hypothetical protein
MSNFVYTLTYRDELGDVELWGVIIIMLMMITKNKYKNWKEILWNNIQLKVYNLQHKIYCHAKK